MLETLLVRDVPPGGFWPILYCVVFVLYDNLKELEASTLCCVQIDITLFINKISVSCGVVFIYSMCQNATLDCADAQCPVNVKCPGDFVYRTNLKLCGNTCSDYMSTCQSNDYMAEGCTCPEGYVEAAGVSGI